MPRDYSLPHLFLGEARRQEYKSPRTPRFELRLPAREPAQHAKRLRAQLRELENEFESKYGPDKETALVTISGKPDYDLKSESAADKRTGTELLVVGQDDEGAPYAVLRVPRSGLRVWERKIDEYEEKRTSKGNPKHNDFIRGIENIRLALLRELFIGDSAKWPKETNIPVWWEVWLRGGTFDLEQARRIRDSFVCTARRLDIELDPSKYIEFGERQVLLVRASVRDLSKAVDFSEDVAEIHPPSRAVLQYLGRERYVAEDLDDFQNRCRIPGPEAPRVAIIDTGLVDKHPLLERLVAPNGLHTVDSKSGDTGDYHGHGTEVAGIAAYGDLAEVIGSTEIIEVQHLLESIRIPLGEKGTEELWGGITKKAVETVEQAEPNVNRVFNMSIGAKPSPGGRPTSWSAAVDLLCYNNGRGRLMTVAAGNVYCLNKAEYPSRNLAEGIDDPGQALNAITVGGFTRLTEIIDPSGDFREYELIAAEGELSPYSKSGPAKHAIKPEILCEAGNVLFHEPVFPHEPPLVEKYLDGISLLTTGKKYVASPLVNSGQTSMAAPQAARMLATIWALNPNLRPATVRGLLIHSASWTEEMIRQFPKRSERLRACGYGVPDVRLAARSARSAVTLIAEDELSCGYNTQLSGQGATGRYLCYYAIPWPKDLLIQLEAEKVELRVTLSFFAEPNPKQPGYVYEGASLAWDMQGPNESDEDFFKRVNGALRASDETGFTSSIDWEIGPQARSRGTVQSDRWRCTAVELASCGHVVVFPRNGWWKDNPKRRPNPVIPFSLIISVLTQDEDIDLYVPIQQMISVDVDA